jgi:hypothetical protein
LKEVALSGKEKVALEEDLQEELRDYGMEVRTLVVALLNAHSDAITYSALADEVIDLLRKTDPDLLQGWMDVQLHELMRNFISGINRSRRSYQRVSTSRRRFGDAVESFVAGDASSLSNWLEVRYQVDETNSRLPLGKMQQKDLDFAASQYQKRADTNAFEAQFLRALARKVGRGTVEERFTEAQLCEMRDNIDKMLNPAAS